MEHVTSSDGTSIAFDRQGAGDPVVLVHGTTGSIETWALVAPHLESRFTVVTMDRRGRGNSSDGTSYSLDLEADDVAAVVEAVGGAHVVGHSYGARVAMSAALKGGPIRSLVLYEPPLVEKLIPPTVADEVEQLVRAGDLDAAIELFFSAGPATPEETEMLKSLPPVWERIRAGIATAPRELRALIDTPVDHDALRAITVPVLSIVGQETAVPVIIDGLDALEAALPDVRRATIPGQRHLAVGFAPEAFADTVASFLDSVN